MGFAHARSVAGPILSGMTRVLAMTAALLLGVTACGGDADGGGDDPQPEQKTALQTAAQECSLSHLLADDGTSLTLDRNTSDRMHLRHVKIECILPALDTPQHVIDHIYSTRALDGQQTDTWGNIEARWTYHPDSGQQITFVEKPQE